MSDMNPELKSFLSCRAVFTTAQAEKLGVSRATIAYYAKKGLIERISRGLYRNPQAHTKVPPQWEDLVATAQSIPHGVVCLISALALYEMTDEIPREHWIAVANDRQAPRRAHTRIVRFRNVTLGKTRLMLGDQAVKIFDRERTVVDSFRYLSREIAIKALKAYLQPSGDHQPDLGKLNRYARKLRTNITEYVLALST